MRKYILLTGFLFFGFSSYSQADFTTTTWYHIDTAIAKRKNLSDVYGLVQQLKQKAIEEKKYFTVARCYYYQLLITDQRTEDSSYFNNSAFIDSLLMKPDIHPALKLAMHLMQAKRLSAFTTKYLRFNRQRYEGKGFLLNYAAYTNLELDSIAQDHFEQSKVLAKNIFLKDADDVLWLASDPLVFLFKPGLYDIVIAEQINYSSRNSNRLQLTTANMGQWLSLSQQQFIQVLDSLSNNNGVNPLNLYGEWINNHKNDKQIYFFIETLARKYLYTLSGFNPVLEKIYENYLAAISHSEYRAAKVHSVYQLCLLWNSHAQKYFPAPDGYDSYTGSYQSNAGFDTSYQFHAVKALRLFEQNENMLNSFSYLKNILQEMKKKILASSLKIKMEEFNLPGEPLLAELIYKNTPTLHYRIVSVHQNFKTYNQKRNDIIKWLLLEKTVAEKTVKLSLPPDFNRHGVFVKLDPLPAGRYFLLLSDSIIDKPENISFTSFDVTSIVILNNDKRVYVLDRKTGFPLTAAKVEGSYTRNIKIDTATVAKTITRVYHVNKEGYINVNDAGTKLLRIMYGNDTATALFDRNDYENKISDDIYSKDEYDGLLEFYEENARVHIFTDRSIYRPGQTVYYKALFTTKDPGSGETIVMNKQNLRGFLFRNFLKKWIKEEEPLLYLTDPFGKETDSIAIRPNEFGSQAGSFIIPKTAATGEWNIEPDYIDIDESNEGAFSVEEYKRPTFDVSIETSKELLKPGDPFSFKVKVRSFAGASLNNVRIAYTLDRTGNLPLYDSFLQKKEKKYQTEHLMDTTGYTDTKGELEIWVKDSLLSKYVLDNENRWEFNYSLNAEAIDETGESYEAKGDLSVSSRPVRINIPIEKVYERSSLQSIKVSAVDKNSKKISRNVFIKIYRLRGEERMYSDRKLQKTDQWIYPVDDLEKQFPYLKFRDKDKTEKQLVLEKEINTGKTTSIDLPADGLPAGRYEIEAISEEQGKITGEASRNFAVFDLKENKLPDSSSSFYQLPVNLVSPGDKIAFYSGNPEKDFYAVYHVMYYSGKKKSSVEYFYDTKKQSKGINKWTLSIPADAKDEIKLTQVYVMNNRVYTQEERIFVSNLKPNDPEIIIEQYRKKLVPGAKETFSVSIKTKNENVAAELLTTLYDASLDKLEEHHWTIPHNDKYHYLNTGWQRSINSYVNSYDDYIYQGGEFYIHGLSVKPLWWMNPLEYKYNDLMVDWGYFGSPGGGTMLQGRAAGVNIINADGLSEVVVTGYGTERKRDITGSISALRIRGASSLSAYSQPLIILDGVPFTGDLSTLDPKIITDLIVMKGADASAIYGAKAAEGVLLLSTKGEILLPASPDDTPVPSRKNFNETAFFFPQVHADKNGYYKFTFTMPESVTEWNWKLLAHTKKAQFVYAERKLNTQLPLMVQPNMPRLLYQGDRIILQSRISNLDSADAGGKAVCKIEDAVTGEDITALLLAKAQHNFYVGKKANISSAFEIKVPKEQLNPLKIIITVRSGNFADGEEHTIPVLNSRILVRENISFRFFNNTDTVIQPITLPADAELYGLGISILPKPQSALINALPYLANYSFDCAEQVFNKLLAHVTALKIMRTDKEGQESFDKAKQTAEKQPEKKEQLTDELSEQTMPWLNIANRTAEQQKQLFELLDTSRTAWHINKHLDKLYTLQNSDGGLTWFDGGKSNSYISNYVLAGFGKLVKDSLTIPEKIFDKKYKDFIEKLLAYCNNQFWYDTFKKTSFADPLFYAYARSFWKNVYPLPDSSGKMIQDVLNERWKNADNNSLYNQAILIINTLRYFDKGTNEHQKAFQQLNSIEQLAVSDDFNGTRWKDLADNDEMSNTAEETIVLMAEAFSEAGIHPDLSPGIIKWLLTAKNEDHWSSTKATSAVIGMLSKENKTATGLTQTIDSRISNKELSVTDDLLSGNTFLFTKESKPVPVELKKRSNSPATGNVIWYYFTAADSLSKVNKEVNLKKELFKYNDAMGKWESITENTSLRIAGKIKVVLTIESSKALHYIYIDDKRAAAFEPKEIRSGYQYERSFNYYLSLRDAGMQFFSEFIPSGRTIISYEMVVAQEGSFMNGPASLQCMYWPEINAYSNSIMVQTFK